MACIEVCDVCGRTRNEMAAFCDIEHYKVKKETCNWYERSWDRIDICYDCLREIRNKVRKGGKNAN
jgi:hypothetical protein